MCSTLWLLILCAGISSEVYSAVFHGLGECPDGHQPGDIWYPENCQRCDCYETEYSCMTCGVYSLVYNTSECYHYTEIEKQYPDCCQPIIKCRGDDGFEESMLLVG